MVSKSTLKLVKSLQQKKYRKKYELFLAEGAKIVTEILQSSYSIRTLIATSVFLNEHRDLIIHAAPRLVEEASEEVLSRAGSFKNNNAAIAVVSVPDSAEQPLATEGYSLLLENVRDPGNLGTILRIADWYGISQLICSPETTDLYSPKVISGSMGSFMRVKVHYTELAGFIDRSNLPVYGTFPDSGTLIYEVNFASSGLILLGNESEGISEALAQRVSERVTIPRFGGAESLNVGIATAVVCDNLRRSQHKGFSGVA
ncbi:MAG: TrmH family RNA methyltransferase [Cyclobacteriaceae bacterium]